MAGAGCRGTGITHGTPNTILVVEAGDPVPWTKPEDLRYSPNQPLPRLGGMFKNRCQILFADGSVHPARPDPDEKVLRALITCDGQGYTSADLREP